MNMEELNEGTVEFFIGQMGTSRSEFLQSDRSISDEVIKKYRIGIDTSNGRFSIPIYTDGKLANIRLWLPPDLRKDTDSKIISFQAGSGADAIYPEDQLSSNSLLIVEGEFDALAAISAGIPAVTNTAGAKSWKPHFAKLFEGKDLVILMDNDEVGKVGTNKRMVALSSVAKSVRIAVYPSDRREKHDVIDELKECGVESLKNIITSAKVPEDSPLGTVTSFANISEQSIIFLWDPWIPRGMLTMFDGDPGAGKSFLTCAIAAAISNGEGLPLCRGSAFLGTVFMMNQEDSPNHTILPRLKALNANLERIHFFEFPGNLDEAGIINITIQLKKHQPDLLIIDPLISVMGDADTNSASEVRPVLKRLIRMANELGIAVVGVRHLNKHSGASKAIYRGQGSMDFIGAARSVIAASVVPDHPDERVILHIKCSYAKPGDAIGYKINDGVLQFTGKSEYGADILEGISPKKEGGAVFDAKDFLLEFLSGGPRDASDVLDAAKAEGLSAASVRRAKKDLDIQSEQTRIPGEKGIKKHLWKLSTPLVIAFDVSGLHEQNPEAQVMSTLNVESESTLEDVKSKVNILDAQELGAKDLNTLSTFNHNIEVEGVEVI